LAAQVGSEKADRVITRVTMSITQVRYFIPVPSIAQVLSKT
jgi:hypothetical protein